MIRTQMSAIFFRTHLLFLTFLLSIVSTIGAAPVHILSRQTVAGANGYSITVPAIVIGVIAIVSGVFFCFFALRHFRFTMFLVGFWIVANAIYIGLVNDGVTSLTLLLVLPIVVGLIAGLILACCWHIGVYLLAALFGYALAIWILSFKSDGVIQGSTGRIILIVVLVLVFVILTFLFEKPMIVLATSFVGAYLIIFGIDMFAQTGFASLAASFVSNGTFPGTLTWQIYLMLAGVVILTILGIIVQWYFHRHIDYRSQAVAPYGYGTKWGRRRPGPY